MYVCTISMLNSTTKTYYSMIMIEKRPGPRVIPALWEAKVGGSFEVRCLRPAWPTW